MNFDQTQERALDGILSHPGQVSLLTGGPGYGKTTVIQEIIHRSNIDEAKIYIAAPTGKAAKVISDSLPPDALTNKPCTIHRLLGCQGPNMWIYGPHNKLDAQLLILDESSMIDSLLMARVFSSIPDTCTVILVGDKDQLPPVGCGAPFRDLLKNGVNLYELGINHRQQNGSGIADACERVKAGKLPQFKKYNDINFILEPDKTAIPFAVSEIWRDIEESGCSDLICMAPQHKGDCGVEKLNEILQERINPSTSRIKTGWIKLAEHDRVIHTQNNYRLGVYNGYCGTVEHVTKQECIVDYSGEHIRYEDPADKAQLKLGFAITIHKSQGSQWKQGIIVAHSTHAFMWSRSLLYTALSRFRDKLWIIGDKKALRMAIRNVKEIKRQTWLSENLKNAA